MTRPAAHTMVVLRDRRSALAQQTGSWKVTSRFVLQLSATRRLECVRVSCYGGSAIRLHLSAAEFERLFRPETEAESRSR